MEDGRCSDGFISALFLADIPKTVRCWNGSAVSERDNEIASLIEALGSNRARAWRQFLELYSPVILQVIHHYERDDDRTSDCYLFVCQQLRRHSYRRLRRFEPEGPASFTTWLRVVTRNLHLDWRRKQAGRHRMFQAVARMPSLEQAVFDCLYQKGLSFEETLSHLQIERADLTRQALITAENNINRALTSRQFWLLSTRAPREVSLEGRETANGPVVPIAVPSGDPSPEDHTEKHELLNHLRKGYQRLAPAQRLLIRLRYEKELSLDQIARLTGLSNRQQVDREVRKAISRLREVMVDVPNGKTEDNDDRGP